MKIMKYAFVYLTVVGLVLQGFGAQAFAANEADEISNLNTVSGSEELLNQTAGDALPSSIQPLSSDEMKTLAAMEAESSGLLNQTAGDVRCYTRQRAYGDVETVCEEEPKGPQQEWRCGSVGGMAVMGGLACGIVGAIWGVSGAVAGAVGCGVLMGGIAFAANVKQGCQKKVLPQER